RRQLVCGCPARYTPVYQYRSAWKEKYVVTSSRPIPWHAILRTDRRRLLKRREFLTGAALTGAVARGAGSRPNIVVVLMDDLRWDELHCTGHPFALTPNIDRLAAE